MPAETARSRESLERRLRIRSRLKRHSRSHPRPRREWCEIDRSIGERRTQPQTEKILRSRSPRPTHRAPSPRSCWTGERTKVRDFLPPHALTPFDPRRSLYAFARICPVPRAPLARLDKERYGLRLSRALPT